MGVFSAIPEGLFAHMEPFGFVARNRTSHNVFVAFRGTISVEDWLSDFSFPQVLHQWGNVEEGFFKIYDQCGPAVKAAVQHAGGATPVFVTRHSLGAGLAILATADLIVSGAATNAGMYSFAGPRVGDLGFAAQFNLKAPVGWWIVNTEDRGPRCRLLLRSCFRTIRRTARSG